MKKESCFLCYYLIRHDRKISKCNLCNGSGYVDKKSKLFKYVANEAKKIRAVYEKSCIDEVRLHKRIHGGVCNKIPKVLTLINELVHDIILSYEHAVSDSFSGSRKLVNSIEQLNRKILRMKKTKGLYD